MSNIFNQLINSFGILIDNNAFSPLHIVEIVMFTSKYM